MFTDLEVAQVRSSVTMKDICRMYGIKVNRSGFCSCPFHGADKHPSMKVYPGSRGFHCFTCGEGGDVIHFVRKHDGLGFEDAVRKVALLGGVSLPEPGHKRSREETERLKQEARKRKADRELEDSIRQTQRRLMIVLSEEMQRIRDEISGSPPLSGRVAYLTAKLQKLEYQWDCEFERM